MTIVNGDEFPTLFFLVPNDLNIKFSRGTSYLAFVAANNKGKGVLKDRRQTQM